MTNAASEMEPFFNELNQKTESEVNEKLRLIPDNAEQKAYGLKVDIPNPQKIKVKSWIAAKRRFCADIEAELKTKPFAIVHTTAWSELCRKLELFRLSVNDQGGVNANTGELDEAKKITTKFYELFEFALCSFGLGAIISIVAGVIIGTVIQADSYLFLGFTTPVILSAALLIGYYSWLKRRRETRSKLGQKHGELHILFPKMCSFKRGSSIAVDFIDPPPNLHPLILKLQRSRDFEVQIAAHPDAFSVNPEKRVLAWADPIITVVRGDCVAILAQYGNFPQEIKLAKIIASLGFLPVQ